MNESIYEPVTSACLCGASLVSYWLPAGEGRDRFHFQHGDSVLAWEEEDIATTNEEVETRLQTFIQLCHVRLLQQMA